MYSQKIKKIISIIIFSIIITLQIPVFAEVEDEEFDFNFLNEFLQDVDTEINKIPNINSRHAVLYDRSTRKSVIWQKRK